jgi:ACS family allantoate permease-like MFS transporter
MFYTRLEMAERIGWSFACNGLAQMVAGFLSYGVAHAPAKTDTNGVKIAQWQIYMIIISALTLLASVLFGLLFPDSPTKAKFLTEQEKVVVIKRMRSNQAGIETKVFKWYQSVLTFASVSVSPCPPLTITFPL